MQRNPSRADNSSADESDAVTTNPFRMLKPKPPAAATSGRVERRQWWLSSSSIVVTLLLTAGIVLIALPVMLPGVSNYYSVNTSIGIRGLIGVVLLFDLYLLFQQMQIHRFRRQLAEREELFRLISENAADMIALVDVSGHRIYNSPSYMTILGYTSAELADTSSFEQIHPDDHKKVMDAALETRRTGHGRTIEYRIRHKDGRWLTLESTASAVKNAAGNVEKLVIVNRDITERKLLEQQLSLSQKLDAVGRLSGGIAHDFNNLLGVIIGYGEALQQQIPEGDPMREAVDEIQNAGQRAAALTQQLLAFSRKQVLEPKVLDLNGVLSDVDKLLRRLIGEDIDLQISLSRYLGRVKADRSQLEQVIVNLAVNARDAMHQGGKLRIETKNAELTEADRERYRYVVPGEYILLTVSDTGCGMDTELQSHIFEPFFTTKEKGKGTGLGLSTVYGVIKQSGGYVWVNSEVGKGTEFKIYLPRAEEVPEEDQQTTEPVNRAHGSATILVVEDEESLRKLTRTTLKSQGYAVIEACDAAAALALAAKSEGKIDLLLTDVVMPGMSGRTLAEKLGALRPDMKILYMSGYPDGAIVTHGVLNPGMFILRKPFTRDELLRRVEESLAPKYASVERSK
jgi:two-component system, cell cycle sensor histidine kinase and response regulator CckA